MEVEYERASFAAGHYAPATEQDSIGWWIESNLKKGGIESQIEKLQALLAVVGEKLLIDSPGCVGSVAHAIECEGRRHRITDSDH